MTQTSATSRWSYTGNAVTTTFAYTTRIFATTDLDVYLDGVLQSSGYSVTGAGSNSGGNVVFTSAPGSGVVVVIVRDVPYTQETDLLDAGPAPMATIEDMVDKTTILTQQASDLIARSIRQPEADTTAIGRLPAKASRLGKLLQFNATTGDPEVVTPADAGFSDPTIASGDANKLVGVNSAETGLEVKTAAQARAAIGVVIGTNVQAYDADLAALAGLSGVRGDIIYRDVTQWQRLPKGSSGQVLTMGANDPAWTTPTVPRGYLSGLTLSNNGSDATNDIDIAAGIAVDSTHAYSMSLASALTKQLDAAWAVGTNQGGLDTGSIANGVYHVWLIARSDTGVVDVLFSTSVSAPTMPANYDYKRRIGSIIRASAAIKAFTQTGDIFIWGAPVADVAVSNLSTTSTLYTLTVPTGVKVEAMVCFDFTNASLSWVGVHSPDLGTPTATNLGQMLQLAGTTQAASDRILTNTSAQIRGISQNASTTLNVRTLGYVDTRGRNS